MPRSKRLLAGMWQSPVRISWLHTGSQRGVHRVVVKVAGEELWFESPDLRLAESIEAIGSAFVIAAAAAGKRLVFAAPPDAAWLYNAAHAQRVAAEWWGYRQPVLPVPPEPPPVAAPVTRPRTALCFTCGVDSFHSLLRGAQQVDRLLWIHGYDIALADTQRAQAAEASLRCVAAERNLRAVLVRTNLRTHHRFCRANWEHTHGGALATIGHLLSDHVDQLLISASYPSVFDRPWGSHWKLDPWWSSSRLTVTHIGAEKWRSEKLVAIMEEPLVRKHLRVCWENRSPTGNCGQCEKCLRTMLVLEGHGCLGEFPVFPPAASLAANLEQLNRLKQDLVGVYAGFLEMDLSAKVRSALRGLIERSTRPANSAPSYWWRSQHA
ncbi:MAG: hypothetical protein U1F83_14005 [Verrucomicrobiota bacterium]